MDALEYLDAEFWRIGPTAGDRAISDLDIAARMQVSGPALDPWEADTLVAMSKGYLAARLDGARPETVAPIYQTGNAVADKRAEIAAGIKAMFSRKRDRGTDA